MMTKLGLAFLFTTASLVSGCMVGPDSPISSDDPSDEDMPPEGSEAALANNGRTAFNYFVTKGLTEIQAAGIVGNLMQESSVRPTAVQYGGGPGRGIAQWSIGGRWNHDSINLVSFANARGKDRWALNTQLDFIWHELTNVGSYGLADLRSADTLDEAIYAFQAKYERCGACQAGRRKQYAQDALTNYGSGASDSGSGSTDAPTTCYSATLEQEMPQNACVQSKFDGEWFQCDDGLWSDRWSNPNACAGEYPL